MIAQALIPFLAVCPPGATDTVSVRHGWDTQWEIVMPESDIFNNQTRRVEWLLPHEEGKINSLSCSSKKTAQSILIPIPDQGFRCQAILYWIGYWKLDHAECY